MRIDISIDQASAAVRNNLDLWEVKWDERCRLLKELAEGIYSKHILSILPDLIDEIEHNEKRFSENNYAKKFFSTILLKYRIQEKVGTKKEAELTCSQQVAVEIQSELRLVLEALQNHQTASQSFEIAHLLPCLYRIDKSLRTNEACQRVVMMLLQVLCKEVEILSDNIDIIELCDTLILLFWRKGTLPESIESLAANILGGIEKFSDGRVHCSYPAHPERENLSNEEYEKTLSSFFAKLTIEERFNEITKKYSHVPKEYDVIFKVFGFERETSSFSIGDVTVYDPKKEKHIKKAAFEEQGIDFSGVEKVEGNQLSVSVRIRGTDSSSMKLQARKKAERALGLISGRRTSKKALKLSNAYAICDSEGKEVAASSEGHQLGIFHPSELSQWSKNEYDRFGSWLNNDSANQSVRIWLASMDWHRKAIESEQSSEMLLNAWFSIEHLFQGKNKVSLRLPGFLRNRSNDKQSDAIWYPVDRIAQIQLVLSFVEIKHELTKYAGEVASIFVPGSKMLFKLKYHKDFILSDAVLDKFMEKDRSVYTSGGFVAASDDVCAQLKAVNLYETLQEVEMMRDLFFKKEVTLNKLRSEIWRIKDDVYNIYRIRNMLVHLASTESVLVEYYATRSLEYSLSLLTELKWNLLRTKDDIEIGSIDKYFQEWILDGNIGLDAVQSGDMSGFRKWVFS